MVADVVSNTEYRETHKTLPGTMVCLLDALHSGASMKAASQIMHIIGISVVAQAVWGGGRLGLDFH